MAKVLVNADNLTNIANSIRSKNGTQTTYKPSEMSAAIDNLAMVNGIIESYKVTAGGNISAGDFVSYVNEFSRDISDASLATTSKAAYVISAVALSDSKVFIAHSYRSYYYLYGMVCTISSTTITAGTDTQLSTQAYSGNASISAVALSDSKVFIAHNRDSDYYLYGMVCTVSGTTITAGTDTQLSTETYSGAVISAVALSDSKVFIAHSYGSYYYLNGMVCTVSGTTITAGSDTSLATTSDAGYIISAVALSDSKVFIAHSYGSHYYLYGMVCTISSTTITAGSDTSLVTTSDAGYEISAVALSDSEVFIAHRRDSDSNNYLFGMVCTISGTTIIAGTDTQLSTETYSGAVISAVALSDSKVFIAHSYGSYYYLNGMVCTVSGTTITAGSDTSLVTTSDAGFVISAVALSDSKVFIAHSYDADSYYLYALTAKSSIGTTTSADDISGVAKTSGAAGETIQVYVPDV